MACKKVYFRNGKESEMNGFNQKCVYVRDPKQPQVFTETQMNELMLFAVLNPKLELTDGVGTTNIAEYYITYGVSRAYYYPITYTPPEELQPKLGEVIFNG